MENLGHLGESLARAYFTARGYTIIKTNYHTRHGEIDIICTKDDALVFIEVKTRQNTAGGYPEEAVTPTKQGKMAMAIDQFLIDYDGSCADIRCLTLSILFIDNQPAYRLFEHDLETS